jgi:hypothetical protein
MKRQKGEIPVSKEESELWDKLLNEPMFPSRDQSMFDIRTKRKLTMPCDKYLPGIPERWAQAAALAGGGKEYIVGALLWRQAKMRKTRSFKSLSINLLKEFGISRQAYYRAVASLVKAKLITRVGEQGRKPVITLLDVPVSEDQCS